MTARLQLSLALMCLFLLLPGLSRAVEEKPAGEGSVITFWPFFDYRESPREGFSNLGILGPFFKFEKKGQERQQAVRPFFFRTVDEKSGSAETEYLYPLASSTTSPEETSVQALTLFQKHIYRKDEAENREQSSMLFPFYISGTSKKYGPYTSVFPLYGDIYERFWRDEYHYVLFPLYSRTVNKGTTSTNYLYPFFNTVKGEKESGFQIWPLYGQAEKEGVYRRRFVLWPFYLEEERALDTDNPTKKRFVLPLYAASDSPRETARSYFWPFFGYRDNALTHEEERDYFWPFWVTVRGGERQVTRFIPFYAADKGPEREKEWYGWPIYRRDAIVSPTFRQERDRILYFLYSDNRESWPQADQDRRRIALWPLFVYDRNPQGIRSLSVPAPVEPILNREGIERNWAPFWRLYQQRWNDNGDSAVSLFWNLYWHEVRGEDAAYEAFPLVSYRREKRSVDLSFLKGLIRYRTGRDDSRRLSFFWLPIGPTWGGGSEGAGLGGREGQQ